MLNSVKLDKCSLETRRRNPQTDFHLWIRQNLIHSSILQRGKFAQNPCLDFILSKSYKNPSEGDSNFIFQILHTVSENTSSAFI